MTGQEKAAPRIYTQYPRSSTWLYNGTTIVHFLLGGLGIVLGYHSSWLAYLGILYAGVAFIQMYVIMPLKVCPNCVYYRTENSVCISGLNVVSRQIAKPGDGSNFSNRAKGLFCHNNLYMAALILPIILMIPALVLNFSITLLVLWLIVVGLLLFRIFVLFKKIACVHCAAKQDCPNAQSMGIAN